MPQRISSCFLLEFILNLTAAFGGYRISETAASGCRLFIFENSLCKVPRKCFYCWAESSEEKLKNNGTEKAKQKKLLWAARTMLLPNMVHGTAAVGAWRERICAK